MALPFLQVDAFTNTPFTGNPAAVCLCPESHPGEEQMQQIAAEMNLSETAFLAPRADAGAFDLRWFTPTQEVDLCGHATLASAHALWETGHAAPESDLTFHTPSGSLAAAREANGWIRLDFPAEPVEECAAPEALSEALGGASPSFTGANRMDLLVLLEDEDAVRALAPDFRLLAQIDVRGVIATASADADADYDFASRFFGPRAGVDEDPVTGSAHCALAPFWAERLGQERLAGRQVSRRGGTVRCEHRGARVLLGGQAVTVLRGELVV